mmetsp:Transcript_16663/g.22965  ORF Transcript_16663/g.22965 Transcript_16663/m.22965 type:complete len:574 (-) Transcript_16663:168-1889(-)|eukprot:CAMPEP_0196580222 /NCGR_PEP_ID=MMETSP1081-20130531/27883_1 /TAXON_ID=36882 /ORGANISM="Pyramimonas amylifera, Strain CCMP720" /LENGTH=573 /DNA_ID=CAMNT_0041900045 /DNA_START=202 /DNA_END=1923 /DNA_ORIENTATION=+
MQRIVPKQVFNSKNGSHMNGNVRLRNMFAVNQTTANKKNNASLSFAGAPSSTGFSSRSASTSAVSTNGSSAGSSTSAQFSFRERAANVDPEELRKQAKEVQELVQEIVRVAIGSGPSGVTRGVKAMEALLLTGSEVLRGDKSPPPVLLRRLFERLGSTYVKLGQFVASSPTLFPEEYVKEFQKCLDQTQPVPFDEIRKTIVEELGRPIESVFASIDPFPLASASVAQVHSAVLRDSNKEVVIKVLKPGVKAVLDADLSFLYLLSRTLETLNPALKRTSLASIVGDIRSSMMEEVDFTKEARNIKQFQDYLDRMDLSREAVAPFVYEDLSSRRVLTMERLRGVPLTDLDSIKQVAPDNDPEAVLISALNTWMGSVMMCESFHADVHAGNLLVLTDGRVAFIDFGIVGRLSPVTWNAVQVFAGSAASNDFQAMAGALATMGATDQEVDVDAFARDLKTLYSDLNKLDADLVVVNDTLNNSGPNTFASGEFAASAGFMVDEAQINDLLLNIVRVGETHGVKFPREFGLLLKQVLYFDRYVRLLAPGLQVMNDDRVKMSDYSDITDERNIDFSVDLL